MPRITLYERSFLLDIIARETDGWVTVGSKRASAGLRGRRWTFLRRLPIGHGCSSCCRRDTKEPLALWSNQDRCVLRFESGELNWFWGILGRSFFHAFLTHAKWMSAYPEMRKIYDEKNEFIVYFDQQGPDKPTMSHGAYAISATKRRLQEEQK